MSWPRATDYSAAVQNPPACFADEELRQGTCATTGLLLGLPLSYSGNFATVFKMACPNDQTWAVKCFTRPVEGLRERYRLISRHLETTRRRFAVEFHYLTEGIRVEGKWYPAVKMRWVEGFTLNEFLRDHADSPALLDQLAHLWLRLAGEMREAGMAHGDLQHGNVLLVPGRSENAMALRLIDYDGMWVPTLADNPPKEAGHANYQHPLRQREGAYDAEIDRFSHLVIYTALRAVQVCGRSIWERHDSGENLLFKEADFASPERSKLFAELLEAPDDQVRALATSLFRASRTPLATVPLLSDLVARFQAPVIVESSRRQAAGEALPAPRIVEVPLPSSVETAAQSQPFTPTSLDAPALPPTPRLVPPRAPTWFLRLGFSEDGPLSRYWPVTVGTALALPIVMLGLLMLRPVLERPRPVAAPETPRLFAIDPVTVRAGRAIKVVATIDRPRRVGPLQVRVTGLPANVRCNSQEVPEGEGPWPVTLTLLTRIDTPAGTSKVAVQLYQGEEKLHEQSVALTITPFPKPKLGEVMPVPIVVLAGHRQRVVARVEANGNTDRWVLRLKHDGKLPGLDQRPTPRLLLRPDEVGVDLIARSDAPVVKAYIVPVVLSADGHDCDKKLVPLLLERLKPEAAVEVIATEEVHLKAGGQASAAMQLLRRDYDGPLTLRLAQAPPGVSARDIEVPAGGVVGVLTLVAGRTAGARIGLQEVAVAAWVGDRQVGVGRLKLHLTSTPVHESVPGRQGSR